MRYPPYRSWLSSSCDCAACVWMASESSGCVVASGKRKRLLPPPSHLSLSFFFFHLGSFFPKLLF
ncbi:GPI-anchored surface protein, putative [Bodo saltans]|uniref:GPI-anchored surface protein, putative n=1 Tax=Bodo saltans TaxID=75058 RepID=A0A0S4JUL7_BODSA|nr:GPI-anchored surface protein, putative [Bodo saltans]|eukprot:CUG93930.1 GPI-anchored surface protein, putative [Bodo saltans]